MTKHTRYRFFIIVFGWLFVFYFGLQFIENVIREYLSVYNEYILPLYWIFGFVRTFAVLGMIGIVLYVIYSSFKYFNTAFSMTSKIPVHEAFFHGYFDLAYVYDRLQRYGDTSYDTKARSVIVRIDQTIYYVLVRDIFGRLEGDTKSDTWYIVSKKRKQYGNVRYLKRKPLPNPIMENKKYINQLPKEEGVVIKHFVCLTGLRHNTFHHDQINTVYEMEGLLLQASSNSSKAWEA